MIRILMASVLPLMDEEVFNRNLGLMHPFRRSRVLSYRNKIDRCRSLAAGLLLRKALLGQGAAYEKLEVTVGEHGKPMLCKNLHYSLSHAGDYAAAALADVPVGIDIEAQYRFAEGRKLAERFLTQPEIAQYERLGEEQKPKMLARAWTRKEAFAKADGRGMSINFRTVDTLAGSGFWSAEPVEGYMVSVYVRCGTPDEGDSLLRSILENGKIEMEENWYA